MALSSTRNPLLHTTDEWNAYKHLIEQHYMEEHRPLKDVQKIMKDDYGFEASVKAYKRRFEMWKWEKNVTRPRLGRALDKNMVMDAAGSAGPPRRVESNAGDDHTLTPAKIERYRKKNRIDIKRFARTQALWHRAHSRRQSPEPFPTTPRLFVPAQQQAFQSIIFHGKAHMQRCIHLLKSPKDDLLRPRPKFSLMDVQALDKSVYVIQSSLMKGEGQTALLYCRLALQSILVLAEDQYLGNLVVILGSLQTLSIFDYQEPVRALFNHIAQITRRRCKSGHLLYHALAELPGIDLSEIYYLRLQIEEIYLEIVQIYLGSDNWRYEQQLVRLSAYKMDRDLIEDSEMLKMVSKYDDAHGSVNEVSLHMLVELGHKHHYRGQLEEARSYYTAVIQRTNASNSLNDNAIGHSLECWSHLVLEKVCTPADHDDGILMMEKSLAGYERLTEYCGDQRFANSTLQIIGWLIADASKTGDIDRVDELYDRKIAFLSQKAPGDTDECDVSV